jgi:hypothetical protein
MGSRSAVSSWISRRSWLSGDAAPCTANLSLHDGAVRRSSKVLDLVHAEAGDFRHDVLGLSLASEEIIVALFLDMVDEVEDDWESDADREDGNQREDDGAIGHNFVSTISIVFHFRTH